ncbi:MAG TPA: hypothetical protein VMF51_16620 [Nocardioides sp.]|uniref:hypothetical protein n=1 Tax=Nocardioides sp. TaxID=35761 RepID=UPI002D18D3D2|nr:hypothetical protein [Nocardioides sp.]HTW16758.1 hypothetical protein [Nocardioides sp.]
MKISIDTDVDSFGSAIGAVHAAYGVSYTGGSAPHDEEGGDSDDFLPGKWTRPRLKKLVEWLGESDAAMAVRYIAEHAPAVGLDEVFEFMGEETGIKHFDGKAMGGRMSAVGFARNAIGGGVGPIYDTDYNSRKYRMDKRLAAALLEELDAYENA